MGVIKVAKNVTGYKEAIAVSIKQHIAIIGQPKAKFVILYARSAKY